MLVISALVLVAVWLLLGNLPRWIYPRLEKSGQFGDTFGFVNALFSGLAFVGVVVAILLQREDLKIQRQDFMLTLEEYRKSAEAQQKSERALAAQARALLLASRLNAVSSAYQSHAERAEFWRTTTHPTLAIEYRIARDKYRQSLEAILNEAQLGYELESTNVDIDSVIERHKKNVADRIKRECSLIEPEYAGPQQARALAQSIVQEIRAVPPAILDLNVYGTARLRSALIKAEEIVASISRVDTTEWIFFGSKFDSIADTLD